MNGTRTVTRDEGLRDTTLEALANLKPVLDRDPAFHTAGTASQISDGAGALLLMTAEKAEALGLVPQARIVDTCIVGSDPVLMLTGPIPATEHLLERNRLTIDDIDVVEINEAFASVVLGWQRATGADMDRVNPNGGAIALGHPLGGTGTILLTKAVHELGAVGEAARARHDVLRRWARDRHHHRTGVIAMTTTPVSPVAARYLGQSVTRKEDQRLLTGHGLYVDDVRWSGTLHAAFLRSDLARAAITRIDTTAAKEMPGVVAVYTWEDFNGINGPGLPLHAGRGADGPPAARGHRRPLRRRPGRRRVAETRYLAEDTCEAIEVDYDPQTSRRRLHQGRRRHRERRARRVGPRVQRHGCGAVHAALPRPRRRRSRTPPTWSSATSSRTATSPSRWRPGASWRRSTGGATSSRSSCATQSVHETRNFFARYLQIPEGNVHVTARDVGGGFGQKMFVYREECAVVLASFLLGHPVKWIEDRRENLLSAGHSRNEYAHVRLAVDDDGIIQAITGDHMADVGAYAVCPAAIDPMLLPGPYKIPRLGFSMEMVWTNTMGKAAYRGPWMFETTAREMAIDYAANEIGLDPAEFRRRNLLAASDLPFTAPTGNVFQEITPLETLEQALEMLDYEAFRKEQAEALAEGRLPRRRASARTWSRRRWVATPSPPRPRT